MEKTIRWEPGEAMQMQLIEQQKMQVLAQIGALMMDLEQAKKTLEGINDRHKSAVQQALALRGIGNFDRARPVEGGVILHLSESEVKPNGGA